MAMWTNRRANVLLAIIFVLVVVDAYLIFLDLKGSPQVLTFAMLDVGQGDALFIESPTGTQVLFDGGPARKILGPLKQVISPFDRHIDALIITNPDADHIGGFSDVLKNYEVGAVLEPGTTNDSATYKNIKAEIANKKIPNILVEKGMRLNMGGGTYIDVLFPDRDISTWSRNDASVVAKLVYGDTSIMLTGDSTTKTERAILTEENSENLQSTVLKVGHHGSRTSSSLAFVDAVSPEYALISSGKGNNYGHPHNEVLQVLQKVGAQILRTDTEGTIVMKSDGKNAIFSFIE